MQTVFVTGTDTGVGKTTICSGILKLLGASGYYWKPIQTGSLMGEDTVEVVKLSGNKQTFPPCYSFPDAKSPHQAAKIWGKKVEVSVIEEKFKEYQKTAEVLVIEGAGGLLVPLNDKDLQVDLIKKLKAPVLIISEDRLGTINHTLLTLQACKDFGIPVLGVVLTKCHLGDGSENGNSIIQFGKVSTMVEMKYHEDRKLVIAAVATDPVMKKMFNVKN